MITLSKALGDARRQHLAIGHFNVSDLIALKAVTEAARELKVPVIVGTSEGEREFFGVRDVAAMVASLRERLDLPIFRSSDLPQRGSHSLPGRGRRGSNGWL